jgi:putative transposase
VTFYHINFHTVRAMPVFEQAEHDAMMRACLPDLMRDRQVPCLVWELMPTHVHLLIDDFPDFDRSIVMKHLKGDSSRAFFRRFPELRADLLGGHLWSKGYYAVPVVSHRQYCATLNYIRANRTHADLPPPVPLLPVNVE